MQWNWLFFWNHKSSSDNDWHPQPGRNPVRYLDNSPAWLKRTDIEATVVDAAPFVAGAGALAHISQLNNLGLGAHFSPFKNRVTLKATHSTALFLTPLILLCQAANKEYRLFIPRWSHDRERRRDEEEVRKHIDVGMGIGAVSWVLRMYVFNLGRAYWFPVDVILGGGLTDLLHREYIKAHDF